MATPYAMFALNGGNGIWNYNAESQSVSVLGQKVGIGTSTPTALLEVVGTGGDDSVKLPAGSIGASELDIGITAVGGEGTVGTPLVVNCPKGGYLLILGAGSAFCVDGRVLVDGVDRGAIPAGNQACGNNYTPWSIHRRVPVEGGTHTIQLVWGSSCGNCVGGTFTALFIPAGI